MSELLPSNGLQWGLVMTSTGKLRVEQLKVPKPVEGTVLIKVMAAPLNPSDLYGMKGNYDAYDIMHNVCPIVPGNEGAGLVVFSGGGSFANSLVGKRVAFSRKREDPVTTGGAYQQFCMTDAMNCIVLEDSVSYEEGSMHIVNPLSALGLCDTLRQMGAKAAIQTGGASQVGKMLNRLC